MSQKYQSVSPKQAEMLCYLLEIPPQDRTNRDIKEISNCLQNVKFLKNYMQTAEYSDMLKNLELEQWSLDHVLFKQGEQGDKFYIILTGVIGLFINIEQKQDNMSTQNQILGQGIREVARLYPGDAFGELSLLFDETRTATAVCVEPTSLLVLNKDIFDKYLSNAKNENLDCMIQYFSSLWIFRNLSRKEILKLSTKTTLSKCQSNTVLIRQNEKPKGIFFVHNGIAKIVQTMKFRVDPFTSEIIDDFRNPSESQIKQNLYKTIDMELDEVGNGGYFCDYEMINDIPVQYSAVSLTPTEILTVSLQDLKSVIPKHVMDEFVKASTYYPSSEKIKKQFFENLMWKGYKSKIIQHVNINIVNEKRMNLGHRERFLNQVDLNNIQIYDDVQEELKSQQSEDEDDLLNKDDQLKEQADSEDELLQQIQMLKINNVGSQMKKAQKRQKQSKNAQKSVYQLGQNSYRQQAIKLIQSQRQKEHKLVNGTNKQLILPKINKKSDIYHLINQKY